MTNDYNEAINDLEEATDHYIGFVADSIKILYSKKVDGRVSALVELTEDQIERFTTLGCDLKPGNEEYTYWFNGFADITGKVNKRYKSINSRSLADLHITLNEDDGYMDLTRVHVTAKPADAPRKMPTRTVSF